MAQDVLRREILKKVASSMIWGAIITVLNDKIALAEPVCADIKAMDKDAAALRTKLNYHETTPDPLRPCARCALFGAGESGPCGTCQVFQGPTNSNGHCDFWLKAFTP